MGILRDIGAPGLIIIVLGALLIFGPKRYPNLKKQSKEQKIKIKKSKSGLIKKLCTLESIVWLARVQSFLIF